VSEYAIAYRIVDAGNNIVIAYAERPGICGIACIAFAGE
jgi:hypothetical protein